MKSHRISVLTLALTALFVLVASATYASAQTMASPEISRLLNEAKTYAHYAESDAAELHSYSNSRLSWQTHAHQLEIIRGHINHMGKLLQQMEDIRHEGSSYQQDAIDRIDPLLRQMADQLTVTIEHGNKWPERIHMMKYKNYTKACYDLASQTSKLISDIVAYDKAMATQQMYEHQLEMSEQSE